MSTIFAAHLIKNDMSWTQKEKDFGVLKITNQSVRIHSSNVNYTSINIGYDIKDARWAGDAVAVTLANGKVRRYTSSVNYTSI